MINRMRMLLR